MVFVRKPLFAGLVVSGGVVLAATTATAGPICTNAGTVTYEGAVTILNCTAERLSATATGPSATLNVDNGYFSSNTNGGPGILFKADDDAANPTDITLNLTGTTTVLGQLYDGVDVRTVRGDITVNIGENVSIAPDETGVYVASTETPSWPAGDTYIGGNVTITNRGTVIAGATPDPMGTNGIAGLANGGGVSIVNYGTVTTTNTVYDAWDTYGILADGGHSAAEVVPVSIYNDGTVTAMNDGLRVNSYNGLASVVNDVNGVVTSNGRRGVVVWSDTNSAILTNYGTVTSFDGPGVNVWAGGAVSGDATLVNSGAITSHDNLDRNVYATLYNGAHIWSQTYGKAELINLAGGSLVAPDGWGAWLMSTDGDVVIDNAGLIKGASTAIHVGAQDSAVIVGDDIPAYAGAMGGDLTIANRGIVTAFATVPDPQGTFGLVTLSGDVNTASFINEAGGVVGAGLDLDEGFDAAKLPGMTAGEFGSLSQAAGNLAIFSAVRADEVSIGNAGVLFGRVVVETPAAVSEGIDIPDTTGAVAVTNSGSWVVTGLSSITADAASGTFRNSGAIWALDKTGFEGDFVNAGILNIVATTAHGGGTSILGDYTGTGLSRLSLSWPSAADVSAIPALHVEGDVSGRTEVLLANPWQLATVNWAAASPITVVTVEGDAPAGASHFYMDQSYGLVNYGLAYASGEDETWSLTRGVNVDGAAALSDTASAARNLLGISTQLVTDRIDELRDLFFAAAAPAAPMSYAPVKAPSSAFAGIDQGPGAPSGRLWLKATGETSNGDGYDMDTGVFQGGLDLAREVGSDFVAAGLIAGYGRSTLDFNAGATDAAIDGPLFGAYATYVAGNGVFVNGIVMGQVFDVDMTLASVSTDFSGSSVGGRVETGVRLDYGTLVVEPSVALQASYTSFDTVNVAAITAGFDDTTGLAAEGRLRLAGNFRNERVLLKPYTIFTLGYEFLADDNVVVPALDSSYAGEQKGVYGDLSAGLAVSDLTNSYGGFVQGSFDFTEDRTGVGIKLGGQLRF
ncbi:autotransporter domain-containing protein [Starkeya koreensis]|uniref:Autotransporter domain-containing protein n=1 Tax=Ancylobacter koreensis TaxID=266121 RepID=A0ABT0DGN0_9HYPH|nr:autotransporter outer membrane beta-barrel domain-containing protein [Ancylobacter koreensis]MCK0206429.1 autotransporter domain-containing protein [Ancylobacter koreensis]